MTDRLEKYSSWLNSTFIQEANELISITRTLEKRIGPLCQRLAEEIKAGGPEKISLPDDCRIQDLAIQAERLTSQLTVIRQAVILFNSIGQKLSK